MLSWFCVLHFGATQNRENANAQHFTFALDMSEENSGPVVVCCGGSKASARCKQGVSKVGDVNRNDSEDNAIISLYLESHNHNPHNYET